MSGSDHIRELFPYGCQISRDGPNRRGYGRPKTILVILMIEALLECFCGPDLSLSLISYQVIQTIDSVMMFS